MAVVTTDQGRGQNRDGTCLPAIARWRTLVSFAGRQVVLIVEMGPQALFVPCRVAPFQARCGGEK